MCWLLCMRFHIISSQRMSLRNQVVSSLVWLWWVIDLVRFEFESGTVLFYFSFTFVSFRESHLFVSWCAGGRCGMACSDEDHGRNRRPSAEDQGWSHRSSTRWPGSREVGWRCVRSAPDMWRLGASSSSWSFLCTVHDHEFSPNLFSRRSYSPRPWFWFCTASPRVKPSGCASPVLSVWYAFFGRFFRAASASCVKTWFSWLFVVLDSCRLKPVYSWAVGSKSSRFSSLNHSQMVSSRTRP
jgi:hypothetical protein